MRDIQNKLLSREKSSSRRRYKIYDPNSQIYEPNNQRIKSYIENNSISSSSKSYVATNMKYQNIKLDYWGSVWNDPNILESYAIYIHHYKLAREVEQLASKAKKIMTNEEYPNIICMNSRSHDVIIQVGIRSIIKINSDNF